MIEKRITQPLLEAGELALTEREQTALGLPEHSTTITVELEGDSFNTQWSGRGRKLTGEVLTERLQDYGQAGGLLRLRLVDSVYRLLLLPPGAAVDVRPTYVAPPPPVKTQAARKAIQRRATVDRQFHSDDEYRWNDGSPRTIGFLSESRRMLGEQLKAAGFDALELVELRLQGEELATLDDFEELLAVDVANVDRMPHQEAVARHALSRLKGRAVLADEVGLGKTIEAGLAVKELTLRGLAKRVLILCPAPLRDQWREEMNLKFDLPFDVAYSGADIRDQDKLILSLTLARNRMNEITKQPWDIVIIDEAHRAAGAGARKTRELITALTTACRYAFFLTATPVQNDLLELYRLVELLRPGTFTSVTEFKRKYVTRTDPRTPNDPAALRRLISSVMIRTTRAQAGVDRVTRRAVDVPVTLGPREQELYALSTDLLRNVMQDSGDTMRRRSLALRLTASPFSMGTTALRMAERHPSDRVRRVLTEVGHLAMDIKGSARENKAMEITSEWVREHGRVLIFTQHTDTVTGLLRRMESEGMHARSFHGSMSAAERSRTIAAFRSGETPVMISTDAGAEGQNLQFCNCVLNYDLPWNPMRIEQRIGRVDRLTQPREEVFIANLYAQGTIDESVYKLLAQKLRMFELLFGQVTTILGELDDSKSATFETRVMEALFADTDTKMGRLLKELGTELVIARERASELIAADSGLSNWMATSFDHREGLTKEGASELRPEVTERARIRQRRVQAWVRQVFSALDAEILHDTGEGDGAFLTVRFDQEVADELGGRTVMHLAFDRIGMEFHPDAELCAVGSPVFDEILGLLRLRGDLHATVPVIPENIGPSPYRHSKSTRLITRHLVPSSSWSGQATFRATVGEAETTEHIVTADLNGHKLIRLKRRPLRDGEPLPPAFGAPQEIVAAFEKQAISQLEKLRRDRVTLVEREQFSELKRIEGGYTAQIAEAPAEDRSRLRRALDSEEKRLNRSPDIRARAKLLALTLDEDDWLVEEKWVGSGDSTQTLTYEWNAAVVPQLLSAASRQPIRVLALCAGSHFVDESEQTRCTSCELDRCEACGDDAILADCPVCGVDSCGHCRRTTGGLCRRCGSPSRAPELDQEFAIAWRLNEGVIMRVSQRSAELVPPDGGVSCLVVNDEDVDDPARVRTRAYALSNGLPADCGLAFRELTDRATAEDAHTIQLRTTRTVQTEIAVADKSASTIASAALQHLPLSPAASAHAEKAFTLNGLLARLRNEVPPPSPPVIEVIRRSTFTDLNLYADRLVERVLVVTNEGELNLVDEQATPLTWHQVADEDAALAEAEFAGMHVSLTRLNEAVLVTAEAGGTTREWIALPNGAAISDQLAWAERLDALGTPGGRVGQTRAERAAVDGPFPTPSECQLTEREIEPIVSLVPARGDSDLTSADGSMLAALAGQFSSQTPKMLPNLLPAELNRALIDRSRRSFTTVVLKGFDVREVWSGHGRAVHRYEAFDGQAMPPLLADVGAREEDFGVCREGHFYSPGTAACCKSCDTWACRACDEMNQLASLTCGSCSAEVCRRCLLAEHDAPPYQCVLCDDAACPECGRDPHVEQCEICSRGMCSVCREGAICPACSSLAPAPQEIVDNLPSQLAAVGATVVAGYDAHATTLLINRGRATIEQVVLRNGAIDRWVAFDQRQIEPAYELRLAASRELGQQVVPTVKQTATEPPGELPHLVVQSERSFRADWTVKELAKAGRGAVPFSESNSDLYREILVQFPKLPQLPTAVRWAPDAVRRAVASMPNPRTLPLDACWACVGSDVTIIGPGIHRRLLDGSEIEAETIQWIEPTAVPSWVAPQWDPLPTVRATASFDDVDAVVVSMASLLALGIRSDGTTSWYEIVASPQAPAATALARLAGLGDADEVSVYTDPAKIVRSSVINAIDIALTVDPVIAVGSGVFVRDSDTTSKALAAWRPAAHIRVPELLPLTNRLRLDLVRAHQLAADDAVIEIGARVKEVVKTDRGGAWKFDALLSPGQTDARRTDSRTRAVLDLGTIDREGHFGADDLRCPYCEDHICTICTNGLVTCDCCGVSICRRCVREPHKDLWLCLACDALRAPTRAEARQHGRLMSTKGMLIGTDERHVVVVEQSKKSWVRHTDDGQKHPLASPSLATHLSDQLAIREPGPREAN